VHVLGSRRNCSFSLALFAVGIAGVGVALGGCSNAHSPEYQDGYSYGHSAAGQDYSGSLTGSAADDACNHALQAVPDGFGDPSNSDWVSGFMDGCKAELEQAKSSSTSAVAAPASSAPSTPQVTATCVVGYEQPKPDPDVLASEVTSADYTHSKFRTGTPVGVNLNGDYWAPTMAYKLILTNNSQQAITVQDFTVAFYNSSGGNVGSDEQQNVSWLIGPGKSQTWIQLAGEAIGNASDGPDQFTENQGGNVVNSTGFGGGPPDNASTCRLEQENGSLFSLPCSLD
jgi:hypothetical protein